MEELRKELEKHSQADDRQFSDINSKLNVIEKNHLFHIEQNIAKMAQGFESLHEKLDTNTKETIKNTTNLDWMRYAMTAVGIAVIGQVVTMLFKN